MTKPSTNSSSYLEHRDLLTGLMLPPSHKTPILSLLLVTCSLVCFWPTLSLWNYTLEAACRQLLTTKGFRILPETSHLRHTLLFTVIKTDRIRARRHTILSPRAITRKLGAPMKILCAMTRTLCLVTQSCPTL